MPIGQITEGRARVIAAAIARHMAGRLEFSLNPSPEEDEGGPMFAKKIGVDSLKLKKYSMQVILPIALAKHYDDEVKLIPVTYPLTEDEVGGVALKVLQHKAFNQPLNEFQKRLPSLSNGTGVSEEELILFYIHHILPSLVQRLTGWGKVSITGSGAGVE